MRENLAEESARLLAKSTYDPYIRMDSAGFEP